MNMMHAIAIIAVLSHACVSPSAGIERTQLGAGQYEICCEGNALTVRANDANVEQLLTEFSRKSGIAFNKYVGKTQKATLDLNGVTVEEFLNRVLGSYVATSKKKNGETQISSVTIMDEGGENPPPKGPATSSSKPGAIESAHPPEGRKIQRVLDRSKRISRRHTLPVSPSPESEEHSQTPPPPESEEHSQTPPPSESEEPEQAPIPPSSEEPEDAPPPDSVPPPPPGP